MSECGEKSRNSLIWTLAAISALYLGALVALVLIRPTCVSDWYCGALNKVAQTPINSIGDFLAGAFAPLAFVWLAAAVFLQSRELALQREELRATRDVLEKQAMESRAATKYIGTQTAILKRQEELREQQQADAEFDEMLAVYLNNVRRAGAGTIGARMRADWPTAYHGFARFEALKKEDYAAVHQMHLDIVVLKCELENAEVFERDAVQKFRAVSSGIPELLKKIENLSPPRRIKANGIGLEKILDACQKLEARAEGRLMDLT
ncbi:MAG TPA: hypothetical protein VNZ94_00290 [Xanthobacteraceae bacterium]|nr:hypothetical protein [Xanthobacteraceae bacterium]